MAEQPDEGKFSIRTLSGKRVLPEGSSRLRRHRVFLCAVALAAPLFGQPSIFTAAPSTHGAADSETGLSPIRAYIASGWDTLTRSMSACSTVVDPKVAERSVIYLPADMQTPAAIQDLQKQCDFKVMHLPAVIRYPGELATANFDPQGLLYLENRYVVPGGRFNEMYGWDSYFIIRGLVRDGRIDLARGMVENFFFEIEHYGAVLNANRTYYLSRSQPPFLTSMILSVYDAEKTAGDEDRKWLAKAYSFAAKDHDMWTRDPHRAGTTGLSRYFDMGEGPAAESVKDETGYYRKAADYFLRHPDLNRGDLVFTGADEKRGSQALLGYQYTVQVCDPRNTMDRPECDPSSTMSLSSEFYKGDRSMRESGFDVSFRFGPYGAGTHHFAPVCLNSLLYKTEKDLEMMAGILGKKDDAAKWRSAANARNELIQKYLWDSKRGLFFDYDFESHKRSTYAYVTTFYPLWAGLATAEEAKAVVKNLKIFEQPGGLVMSPEETGGQWDYPYAWAPNHLLAIDGMKRYGYKEDADRIAFKFLSMVADNFRRDGTIREKYNAVTRSSETEVTAGYHTNIVGFGWTNGVFLDVLHDLPPVLTDRLAKEQTPATAEVR